jgi:membrane-bound lytic murein transglycosylase D
MNTRGLVLGAVVVLAGCAPRSSGPPIASAPVPQQPEPVTEASRVSQPAAEPAAQPAPAAAVAQIQAQAALSPAASPRPDTLAEAAFLDSLRTAEADTSARPSVAVGEDEVRREAAELLGRPSGGAAAATWDLDVTTYASHERVLFWIDYFTGRARWHFERYLERSGRYDSMITTRLAAAGLPQDLLYLAMIESGFNHSIRSRAAAVGLWQFIAATGQRYGLTIDAWVDDRRDPWLSTDAAIRFLSELNNRFGSFYLAAAAYNGGPGRVTEGLRRYDVGALEGDARFFALADGRAFRQETRDYVPKLIAAALIGKQPERYGFTDIVRWEPLVFDSVEVRFAVGLDVLARLASTTRGNMEEMNARFYRGVTPPDRRVWVRVPAGAADSVAARLARLPASDRVTVLVHVVERGETLSRIAQRYGTTVTDIRSANRGLDRFLRVGQRLVIPGAVMPATARTAPGATRTGGSAVTSSRPASRSAASTSSTGVTVRRVHIVRQGETLWRIAQDFNVPLDRLLAANGLTRSSTIRPGQAIRIPG